jgi:phospholipid/cholesterol/gamma-HCH transport system substrate-binding protein
MKIKFNKFERVAGLFVLAIIVTAMVFTVFVAVKQKWFEAKMELETSFQYADHIFPGTPVQMSGLKIGAIKDVELKGDKDVTVRFYVYESYFDKLREDSIVKMMRPFIIGDKVIDITMGSADSPKLKNGAFVQSEPSVDLMDLVSGRSIGPFMDTIQNLSKNIMTLADAFADPERSKAFIRIFDEMSPLMSELRVASKEFVEMATQMTKKKALHRMTSNFATMSREMNRMLPEFRKVVEQSPEVVANSAQMVENMRELTDEMKKLIPVIAAVAPELPEASKRAIEALNEAVIVMKAMQKSFLLRSSVAEVREEEQERRADEIEEEKRKRAPASKDETREDFNF